LLGLVILVVLFVRVRLREAPLERDEGEYAYAGQLILHGVPPYKEVYNTKLPGTYIAYAVIMGIFGQTSSGIHVGLMLVNVASILLVFLIGRRVLHDVGAVVAAISFALMSLSPWILGLAGHATHFVVLFALAGIWILVKSSRESSSRGNEAQIKPLSGSSRRQEAQITPLVEDQSLLTSAPTQKKEEQSLVTSAPTIKREGQSLVTSAATGKRSEPRYLGCYIFGSGLLFGVAFLMKQQGMFFGVFGLAYLVWTRFSEGRKTEERRSDDRTRRPSPPLLWPAFLFCAGCAAPYLLTCLVLACAGVFSNFMFWTVSYASKYASAIPITYGADMLKAGLRTVVGPNIVLWILPWAGALFIWWDERLEGGQPASRHQKRRRHSSRSPRRVISNQHPVSSIQNPESTTPSPRSPAPPSPQQSTNPSIHQSSSSPQSPKPSNQYSVISKPAAAAPPSNQDPESRIQDPESSIHSARFFLMALLVCSFISVSLGLYFREHYFIMLLPALALLTGAGVSRAWFLVRNDKSIELFLALPVLLLFVIGVAAALIGNGSTWFTMSAIAASRSIYGTSLFIEAKKAGEYIKENAPPDARVAVLGSEPEIYFYARRRSASGHIYMYPLMETHPFAATMQQQAIGEIEQRNPEFAVYVDDDFSWLAKPESERKIQDWWNAYWPGKMELMQTFDFEEGIVRGSDEESKADATTTQHLLVFRRKNANSSTTDAH
jgi:hypothetical protein